ncbi:hypothetical protein FOZ61_000161 [Perkinsus olseni]|uniref:Uncharacterized protein n=1 Tax=Perkinsus olseni TaxID=32597 RepID=A0A7J6M232_PEROL|nr:hypothetical protein FOZ61_000161 [Perkinsus olseni]
MGGDISVFNRDYYDDRNDAVDTGRGHHARQGYYYGDGCEAVRMMMVVCLCRMAGLLREMSTSSSWRNSGVGERPSFDAISLIRSTSLDHRSLPPELRAIGRCRKSTILRRSAVLILRHMRACPRRCIDHPRCGQKCLVLDQELYNSVPAFSLHGCCECLNPLVAARSELDHKRELLAGPPLPVPLHEIQGYLRECVRYFSCCNELIVIATVYACRFAENVCMRHWNWRIIVAVWEDYCLFLSNLQDCFIYLSKCGLIQLGAYGGGPPLYRLKKLEAFALADILQWNVNIQSPEYYEFYFCLEQSSIGTSQGSIRSVGGLRRLSTTPDAVRKSWVERCPSLCDPTAAELRRRSLDKGNPFVGNWAHSPPAEPMVSLRVLSTNGGMEASPKAKRTVGMLPGRAACL